MLLVQFACLGVNVVLEVYFYQSLVGCFLGCQGMSSSNFFTNEKKFCQYFYSGLKDQPLENGCELLEEKAASQSVECVYWPETISRYADHYIRYARAQRSLPLIFCQRNCLLALNSDDNSPWQDSCVSCLCTTGETQYYNFEFTASVRHCVEASKQGNYAPFFSEDWHV